MTTTIRSNGSKWSGEEPDSIDALIELLGREALDRRFESDLGAGADAFISVCQPDEKWDAPGTACFSGNFFNLSHVFDIRTTDPVLIERFTAAINANVIRPDYASQQDHIQRRTDEEARRRANDAKRDAEAKRQARAVLGLEAAE